jgi:ABC-type sugar transport system permease subunit
LFLLPGVATLVVFLYYPVLSAVGISFNKWNGLGPMRYIGLENYINLFMDKTFWHTFKLTFIWVFLSAVVLTIGGLILAILVEYTARTRFMSGVSRTILFMPMMMSLVAVGLLWSLILNPTMGLLNVVLVKLHLVDPMNPLSLLGNPKTALFAAFLPALWQWSGFGMVVFSAAIMNIPRELLEAAAVDGATGPAQFFRIIIPLLMPTIFTCVIFNLIGAFKAFDLIYTMTKGGPGDATMVTAVYIYIRAFVDFDFGYSTAMAVMLFVTAFIFTYALNKLNNKISEHVAY